MLSRDDVISLYLYLYIHTTPPHCLYTPETEYVTIALLASSVYNNDYHHINGYLIEQKPLWIQNLFDDNDVKYEQEITNVYILYT